MIAAPDRDPWGRDLAGELHALTFDSKVLRDNPLGDPASRPLLVYTPPEWPDAGPYPAVWSIQGLLGQADQWQERRAFGSTAYAELDRMIVAGTCRPVVMPMPDCWTSYGGSQFLDSAGTGAYMTYLCDELVPWVDERFGTAPAAASRAVQGKSSGGYGALVLAMLRPDVWARWLAWDPVRMADEHLDVLRGLRAISLECGRNDEFNLYVGTTMLHRRLDAAGIEHRFELFDGDHDGTSHRYAPLIAWLAERLA